MSDTLNNAKPDSSAAPGAPKATDEPTTTSGFDRRDFLRVASLGTSALLTASCASTQSFTPVAGMTNRSKPRGGDVGHVVVVGAGAWGSWTAFHLRQRGVRVTHIDQYGAGNSRQTSGDESRGIRSSYGDRSTVALWSKWARAAIKRWEEFDLQYGAEFGTKFYYTTGDVICRAADEPFLKNTREQWVKDGVKHEVITGEEVRKRWPVINADDTTIALVEPDAGVARARASTQAIARIGQRNGVDFRVSRVKPGPIVGGKMDGVILEDGTVIKADQYVFCVGAWARKLFPRHFETRVNIPMGTVMYYGTPPGDYRFQFPNLPSFNFPGVTGWAVLPHDSRGFRVRGGINAPPPSTPNPAPATPATPAARPPAAAPDPNQNDPDMSTRWAPAERLEGTRRFVARRFPILAEAPLLETRTCHYDISVNRDFIVDHLPDASNAWFAGMGQSEGFKFAPVVGEYVAQRVMGIEGDPALIKAFAMPTQEYEQNRNREEEEF
ncbi:MAG: NAD(P)/FAD-dependent oxidoreductase [Gemmatimonas sp.]